MLLLPCVPARADMAEDSELHGDIDVTVALDPAAQSGRASAVVRIHALREIVWPLVTSCAEAVKLVPGLIDCEVLQTSPDRTTQVIRQMMEYSWYVPKLTYELRASYEYPERVSIERISGDLAVLKGSWYLESDGDSTIAHYSVDLQPGLPETSPLAGPSRPSA